MTLSLSQFETDLHRSVQNGGIPVKDAYRAYAERIVRDYQNGLVSGKSAEAERVHFLTRLLSR